MKLANYWSEENLMRCGLFGLRFAAPNHAKAHGVKVRAQHANSLSPAAS
jgi:hypothetical protein